jgi:NADP-dependent aldehyde dehydrogenase
LIIGIEGPDLDAFITELGTAISQIQPAVMLHEGISKAYSQKKAMATKQPGVMSLQE